MAWKIYHFYSHTKKSKEFEQVNSLECITAAKAINADLAE